MLDYRNVPITDPWDLYIYTPEALEVLHPWKFWDMLLSKPSLLGSMLNMGSVPTWIVFRVNVGKHTIDGSYVLLK